MFGINWSDPQTFWLNLTNAALGLVTLVCVSALGGSLVMEFRKRWQRHARENEIGREVGEFLSDPHVLQVPGLGLTMADGGEPSEPGPAAKPARKPKGQ